MYVLEELSHRVIDGFDWTMDRCRVFSSIDTCLDNVKNVIVLFFFVSVYNMSAGPYNYSYIFKYIIIGDMGVGKSCLLHQFTEKKCKYNLEILYCGIIIVG